MGQALSLKILMLFETVRVIYSGLPEGYHQATTNRKGEDKMKNTSTLNKVLLTVMAILGVTGLVLITLSMFKDTTSTHYLSGALSCIGVAAILNIIMLVKRNKESN